MLMIKELPIVERPREKLINYGVNTLSNIELIALILRSGNKNKSVLDLSKEVLDHINKLQDLKEITIEVLMEISGIKEAKATTLIAAIELGKRIELVKPLKHQIKNSYDIYHLMKDLVNKEQEHFYCIYLNTKMFVIKRDLIFIGTVSEIVVHPREIFKNAIKHNASFIILVHNHPSGDCEPSYADKNSTKIITDAGNLINIEVIDHIIIGNNEFYSFKESKRFKI